MGWERMACVKPLHQFDWEATRHPAQQIPEVHADEVDGVISCPLDMEWVSGPAYMWAWRATGVVWAGAFATVTFSWCFYKRADWWENGPLSDVLQHLANSFVAVIMASAISYGMYADNKAMSYCIVPWLQNVTKTCKIPVYGQASCDLFRYFSLACTCSQMLTIQLNAWTLGNTIRNRDCWTDQAWKWLWEEGGFGFCPLNLLHSVLLFWGLSTLQLIWPSVSSVVSIPWSKATHYVGKEIKKHRPIDEESYKDRHRSSLSATLSEGVTSMALAAGMRYTGAVSLSYPLAMIRRIKDQKIGFMMKTEVEGGDVWEQTEHGWQFCCVTELQKLCSIQVKRLWFILVFKYACQMNIQVTLFVIKGTFVESKPFNYVAAVGELLSIGAMTLGILSELLDLTTLLLTFRDVRTSVNKCTTGNDNNKGKQGMEARHFFKDKDGHDQEEILTCADLERRYRSLVYIVVCIVLVTAFAMWLICYHMLKFFNFWRCPHHLWSWENGCLESTDLHDYLDHACHGRQ
jgi:hypothetical protein